MGKGTKRKEEVKGADQLDKQPEKDKQHHKDDIEQHATAKKKQKSEIDDIFGSGGKNKSAAAASSIAKDLKQKNEAEISGTGKDKESQAKKPKIEGSKDDLFGEEARQTRKRTEEGYAIYTEEELGMLKKGGDTADCPFDCNCCF